MTATSVDAGRAVPVREGAAQSVQSATSLTNDNVFEELFRPAPIHLPPPLNGAAPAAEQKQSFTTLAEQHAHEVHEFHHFVAREAYEQRENAALTAELYGAQIAAGRAVPCSVPAQPLAGEEAKLSGALISAALQCGIITSADGYEVGKLETAVRTLQQTAGTECCFALIKLRDLSGDMQKLAERVIQVNSVLAADTPFFNAPTGMVGSSAEFMIPSIVRIGDQVVVTDPRAVRQALFEGVQHGDGHEVLTRVSAALEQRRAAQHAAEESLISDLGRLMEAHMQSELRSLLHERFGLDNDAAPPINPGDREAALQALIELSECTGAIRAGGQEFSVVLDDRARAKVLAVFAAAGFTADMHEDGPETGAMKEMMTNIRELGMVRAPSPRR